jgi:hypothetical protein
MRQQRKLLHEERFADAGEPGEEDAAVITGDVRKILQER